MQGNGDRVIFRIESLQLSRGDKIGLVGPNGAGKSTLLAALAGEASLDEGSADVRGVVSLIRQEQDANELKESAVFDADYGRRPMEARALSERPSGGELTRVAIARALSRKPDVILADEPTTNLDIGGMDELRRALASFRGALVVVSHDRDFLDCLCGKIWELENGALRVFPGNYSAWRSQKERERDFAAFEYGEYRKEEKRLRDVARRINERSEKTTKAPSRMSASEARINPGKGLVAQGKLKVRAGVVSRRAGMLEKKDRPADLPEIKMALGVSTRIVSDAAIRASRLSVVFDGRTLFDDAAFEVAAARRTVLLGPNGSGKTTLLGLIERGARPIKVAPSARIGYFSQGSESVNPSLTVLENARSVSDLPEHEVRTILARLGIKGDAVHKKCAVLSGGERAKVAFARLFASNLNTLVLDEPTNHIDLYATEALEGLLDAWRGTLLLVTHDRRLAEKIGDRLLLIEDGKIRTFEGTLREYESGNSSSSAHACLRPGGAS